MVGYGEVSEVLLNLLEGNGITWDKYKRLYFSGLHKEFYLKESEVKGEETLIEFCSLVLYLKKNSAYGVSIEWAGSEHNKYVYEKDKTYLEEKYPHTIKSLARFYKDSNIIHFYKKTLKAMDPTIIDLIGATGAGKTTFCQQFVDDSGKAILEKTITPSGNSTIIQTDIVILEETKNRLFLKARSKEDIIRDMILFALNININFSFDLKHSIGEKNNRQGILHTDKKEIKQDNEVFKGAYNLIRRKDLMEEFMLIAKDLQDGYSTNQDIYFLISNNLENSQIGIFLDKIIQKELKVENFYGYSHEMSLDEDYVIEKTIVASKVFEKYKRNEEGFSKMISYRILFEQATLALECDKKAKAKLDTKLKDGIVFRDSQGHKKVEQVSIATDYEVKNKILLIPAGTGGELIDDRCIEELQNIIRSESRETILVITKLDKSSSYEYYKDSYDDFIENLKDQVVTTHNNLIQRIEEPREDEGDEIYGLEKNQSIKHFISSFDNAYLSNIRKINGEFDNELHKIICEDKENQIIESSDIEDISVKESWYELLNQILVNQIKSDSFSSNIKIRKGKSYKEENIKKILESNMANIMNIFNEKFPWYNAVDSSLRMYSKDFRNIYHEASMWYKRSILDDKTSSGYNVDEMVGEVINYIHSLTIKSEESKNLVKHILESPLANYINNRYEISGSLNAEDMANKIITNAISRSALISYKFFDRDVIKNDSLTNIDKILEDEEVYIQPRKDREFYGIYNRDYFTNTAYYLGIYCNLMSKYKYNLDSYYLEIFKIVLSRELEDLNDFVR